MCSEGAIVYQSKYGSTELLARWLRADTGFGLFRLSELPPTLSAYKTLVIDSSVHMGRLALRGWMASQWDSIRTSRLILMVTSTSNAPCFLKRVMQDSLPANVLAFFAVFLSADDVFITACRSLTVRSLKSQQGLEKPENKAGMLTERDDVRRRNLTHVIAHIKSTDRQNAATGWFSTTPQSNSPSAV